MILDEPLKKLNMTGSAQAARAHSRVAIIGTGLAGLATAHLLQRDNKHRYAVTLFEQVRLSPSPLPPLNYNMLTVLQGRWALFRWCIGCRQE